MSSQWKKLFSDGRNETALMGYFLKEWSNDKYAPKLGEKIIVSNVEEKCYKLRAANEKVVATALPALESNQEEAFFFMHSMVNRMGTHQSLSSLQILK